MKVEFLDTFSIMGKLEVMVAWKILEILVVFLFPETVAYAIRIGLILGYRNMKIVFVNFSIL